MSTRAEGVVVGDDQKEDEVVPRRAKRNDAEGVHALYLQCPIVRGQTGGREEMDVEGQST